MVTATRVGIGIGGAVALVAVAVVAFYGTIILAISTCDGDGGSPYSADASVAGRFCRGPVSTPYFAVTILAPVLIVLALAIVAVARARWRDLAIGVGVAIVLLLAMIVSVGVLPQHCTDEQRARDRDACSTY